MYYVVFKDDVTLYVGSDNQQAFAAFNRGGVGANLQTAKDEAELNALMEENGFFSEPSVSGCKVGCCGGGCKEEVVDEDDLFDDFFDDLGAENELEVTLEDVKEAVNEVVDVTLERLGVTREDVQDFVGRVRDRGNEAAEDTKNLARKGVGVLGSVFTKIGERLSRVAE